MEYLQVFPWLHKLQSWLNVGRKGLNWWKGPIPYAHSLLLIFLLRLRGLKKGTKHCVEESCELETWWSKGWHITEGTTFGMPPEIPEGFGMVLCQNVTCQYNQKLQILAEEGISEFPQPCRKPGFFGMKWRLLLSAWLLGLWPHQAKSTQQFWALVEIK